LEVRTVPPLLGVFMWACIREFVDKKRALSRLCVCFFKYKLFAVKKLSEEVKTLSCFPSSPVSFQPFLIGFCSIGLDCFCLFVCLFGWEIPDFAEVGIHAPTFLYWIVLFVFFWSHGWDVVVVSGEVVDVGVDVVGVDVVAV